MALELDHIVIAVDELDKAVTDFNALGFDTVPGGRHEDLGTHNALIIFKDRTYLELLAPLPNRSRTGFPGVGGGNEGYVGFALLAENIANAVNRLRERGVQITDSQAGSRVRPDGMVVEWFTALIDEGRSPFLIQDETPRIMRVPRDVKPTNHPNEVTGIESITILAPDMGEVVQKYTEILGDMPHIQDDTATFSLERIELMVREPANDDERAYLENHAGLPYEVTLWTTDPERKGELDPGQSHGARMRYSVMADVRHLEYNPPQGIVELDEDEEE